MTIVVWCTLTKLLYYKTSNCDTTRTRFTLLWPTFWSPLILMMISEICTIIEPSKLTWENLWGQCHLMFLLSRTKLLGIWKFWRRRNPSLSQVNFFFWRENSNSSHFDWIWHENSNFLFENHLKCRICVFNYGIFHQFLYY